MSNKTYILQKPLPDSEVGDEYIYNGTYGRYYKNGNVQDSYWGTENVENNPEWFLKKEEQQPKEKDVFEMGDTNWFGIAAAIRSMRDNQEAGIHLLQQMNIIARSKQSKSTPTKTEVVAIALTKEFSDGTKRYEVITSRAIPPEKYEEIAKAIEQTLNH